mmetsp:Transcript_27614/g.67168  ORF Transcript_27614/g.67168 Transcript_27614/m.67168 type:complete len:370 (-) Transcript_27614:107-1216(-)
MILRHSWNHASLIAFLMKQRTRADTTPLHWVPRLLNSPMFWRRRKPKTQRYDQLRNEFSKLNTGYKQIKSDTDKQLAEIQQITADKQSLQAACDQLENESSELGKLQVEFQQSAADQQCLQAAYDQLRNEFSKLNTGYKQIKSDTDKQLAEIQQITADKQSLQAAYDQIGNERDKLNTENTQIERARDKLQAECNQIADDNQGLKAAYNQIGNERDKLTTENKQIKSSMDKLRAEFQQTETKKRSIHDAYNRIAHDRDKLFTENKDMKRAKKAQTEQIGILEDKVKPMIKQLQERVQTNYVTIKKQEEAYQDLLHTRKQIHEAMQVKDEILQEQLMRLQKDKTLLEQFKTSLRTKQDMNNPYSFQCQGL